MCCISAGPGSTQECDSEIIHFQVSDSKVNTHRDEYSTP